MTAQTTKEYTANSQDEFILKLTPESDTVVKELLVDTRPVIPIVFIPGMFSSCLKVYNKEESMYENTWRPPTFVEGIGSILSLTTFEFFGYSAEKHHKRLNPYTTEVDDKANIYGAHYYTSLNQDSSVAEYRGWGGIYWDDQQVMNDIQNAFNALQNITDWQNIQNTEKQGVWYKLLHCKPEEYGAVTDKARQPLTIEDFKKLQGVNVQVWGAPYNWCKDLKDAVEENIVPRIEKALNAYPSTPIKKVILLTHSLGGLAARTLLSFAEKQVSAASDSSALTNEERVWGVSHSCMPATGSPAAYHHVRCGYDDKPGMILGKGSNYLFPLFANGGGVRALLPFKQYKDGAPWLYIFTNKEYLTDNSASKEESSFSTEAKKNMYLCLPQKDSFEEIYMSDAWYGLLPQGFEQTLNPYNIPDFINTRSQLYANIKSTRKIQEKLYNYGYHPVTYAHAESQFSSTRNRHNVSINSTWGNIVWEVSPEVKRVTNNVASSGFRNSREIVKIDFSSIVSQIQPMQMTIDYYDTKNSFFFLYNKYIVLDDEYMADLYTQGSMNDLSKLSEEIITDVNFKNIANSSVTLNSFSDVKEYVMYSSLTEGVPAVESNDTNFLNSAYKADWSSGDEVVPAASGEAPFIAGTEYYVHGNYPVYKDLIAKHHEIKEIVQKHHAQIEKPLISPFYLSNYKHTGPMLADQSFMAAMHSLIRIILDQAIPEIEAAK